MSTWKRILECCAGRFAIGVLVSSIASPVFAQSTLPAGKQVIEQLYQQERAAGVLNPAPKDPLAPYPVAKDAPLDSGIIDAQDGPFSSEQIRISNRWEGQVNGVETTVYAGAQPPDDDPSQGIVIIISDLPTGTKGATVSTPVRGGAVRIVAAHGGVLTLVSKTGSYVLVLNVGALQFTSAEVDSVPPVITGMPAAGCTLWPPNNDMVQVATVTATDALSGVAPSTFRVMATSNESPSDSNADIDIRSNGAGGYVVQLRATRLGTSTGRAYTLTATATDQVGNVATVSTVCTVPHDQGR